MKKQKILIIGAGIGGLSAAGQLAHQGHDVTVVEKNSKPGGKMIQFEKGGFTFDGGASFITVTQVYQDWFKSLDAKLEDYITWKKMEETTTFYFGNGKKLRLYTDPDKVKAEIAKKFPGDEKGFETMMKIGRELYDVVYDGPKLARRNYHKLWGWDFLLDPRVILNIPKLHLLETWRSLVNRLFKNQELRDVFSYQSTFLGMPPSETLATYSLIPYCEIYDGMYSVEDGVYGIAKGFHKLCEEKGVKFIFNAEVTRLNWEGENIKSVTTNQGDFEADIFISNTDGAWFYTNLMPKEKNKHYTENHLRHMRHTNSYFTINLGLKEPIEGLTHHTFFLPPKAEEFIENVLTPGFTKKLNFENTCYYLLQQSLDHPKMAPQGKATAFILVPVPGVDPEVDWIKYEEEFKNFMYDVIEERDGIPIRDLIEVEEIYSPTRWGQEFNLWENVILSFTLHFSQANGFRMPNKSREFENLYFAGSSTIPGPGLPSCISSGELVAERIAENLK